ncbi:partial Outer membrane protein TolC, partial [Anaerolineae bacterium]
MRRTLLIALCLFSLSAQADNLLSLYQRALLASPELKGSQYAVDIAKAQEDQSLGRLLPQAALTGNYSGNALKYETRNGKTYPGTRAGLNIRQPLFDLQAYLLMRSQESKTAQGEDALTAAHQKLIYDLVDRYVDALEAADKSEIIAAELESTEKQLARVKAMSERQMALVTDLYELQARVETLRTNLIESKNDANIALEKLRELTGDAVTGIQPVRLDTAQPAPEGNADTWVEQVSRANPDISALKHAIESADKSISAYEAGHLPRLELQASGNYSDVSFNNQESPPYTVGTIGVEATIPIFEGGITSARVREAEGRKGLSTSQLDQKQRELEKYTRAAYLDMATAQARSLATDRQLEANEKAKLAMEKGYELGVVTIVDLLNAQKQLSESRKIQRQSRYRYFKSRSLLMMEAGQLDVEELAKLNDWLVSDPSLVITATPITASDETPKPNKAAEQPQKTSNVEPPKSSVKQTTKTDEPKSVVKTENNNVPSSVLNNKPITNTASAISFSNKPVNNTQPIASIPENKPANNTVVKPIPTTEIKPVELNPENNNAVKPNAITETKPVNTIEPAPITDTAKPETLENPV